jgi:hypothetical protein
LFYGTQRTAEALALLDQVLAANPGQPDALKLLERIRSAPRR